MNKVGKMPYSHSLSTLLQKAQRLNNANNKLTQRCLKKRDGTDPMYCKLSKVDDCCIGKSATDRGGGLEAHFVI